MIYALNVTRFIFEHYISSNSNVVTAAASGVIVGVVKAKYSKIKISWYLNFQNCIVLDSYHMASNNKVCSKCLKSRSVIARTKFGLWILRVCAVTSVVSNFCDLMGCITPGFSVHGIFLARVLEWISMLFCRDLFDPGIEPTSLPFWVIGTYPNQLIFNMNRSTIKQYFHGSYIWH